MTDCTFCGCDVGAHEPVYVEEVVDGSRTATGAYCNYACLAAHIDAAGLADGAACRLDTAPHTG